jgi:maltose/maltodextrin transport system substrate-binding protein/arabinogalactan oligomer/maltooligosaccharide transport system substrate-binding protein
MAADLVIWADDTRAPILEALSADFESTYGVGIEVVLVGFGDIRANLAVQAPAGEGPDILIGAHDWLGELVTSGLLAPMDLAGLDAEFTDASLAAFTYEGELYGMPYAVENVAFVRNTDLVPEAPATWEDVRAITEELAADGQGGFVMQRGDAYHYFPVMTAFGGFVFEQNADGTYNPDVVGIDSDGSLAAAAYMEGLIADGLMPGDLDWDTMHAQFEQGAAAMFITGPWAIDRLRASGVPYAISPIPAGDAGDGQPFLGVQGFMISAFSENQALAQAFLTEFIATQDVMEELQTAGGRPSAFIAATETIEDPDQLAFSEIGENGLPMPAIPQMSAVWGSWGDAITLMFNQEQPSADAFTNAAEQIRATIAEGN